MFIEPNSHIKIYRGVETGKRIAFKSVANQTAYFTSKLAYDYTPTTAVKYSFNRVRVGKTVAELLGCNYLSFINPSFGNKVYYAFIIGDPVYINNDCTELTYAIDWCQTDMFNVTLEECYIDREHLSDEDYTKSVANPFDASIAEFWTSEPLPVSKDLEKNYLIDKDQTADSFYAAESIIGADGNINMSIVAIPHLTPPNAEEETWYQAFIGNIESDTSQYGLVYINGDSLSNPQGGFHFSSKMISDLFNGVTPTYGSDIKPTYDLFICESKPIIASAPNYIWGDDGLMQHLSLWSSTAGSAVNNIIAVHEMPLYMIGAMFMSTEGAGQSYSREFINVELPNVSSYHNKKLARFPFSYIRIETPSGDIKEYKYERFDLTNAGLEKENTAQFDMNMDYNCQPELSLIPMWYKNWGRYGGVQNYVYNFAERIAFQAIPQMPYATDAFLAGIAASNADILANRTISGTQSLWDSNYSAMVENPGMLNFDRQMTDLNAAMTSAQGIGDLAQSAVFGKLPGSKNISYGYDTEKAGSGAQHLNSLEGIMRQDLMLDHQSVHVNNAMSQADLKRQMWYESGALSVATIESNPVYQNLRLTGPLYVCDKYVPGSGTGLGYFNKHAFLDFIITRVELRASVLAIYDQWFSNYGYAYGAYTQPKIAKYFANAASGKPHFAPSGQYNVTYIKTTGACVKAPSKISQDYWEGMLDAGVTFIRGEDLLPSA